MKSLVTVRDLYRTGKIFHSQRLQKKPEISGIEDGTVILNGEELDVALTDTLSKLTLLYEVPFTYLVPEETMLPPESIRFFTIDPMWVKSFLDGALSIGRNTQYDYSHDEQLIASVYACAVKNNMQIRRNLSPEARSKEFAKNYREISNSITAETQYSGFLLHSSIVQDFKGLEFFGYAYETKEGKQEKKELLIARLDRLSPMVMLGIFCGPLSELQIKQPSESIYLGFLKGGKKTLRSKKDGELQSDKAVEIWEKGCCDRNTGVIHYAKLAQQMSKAFPEELGEIDGADMALELIQNKLTAVIQLKGDDNGHK